MESASYVSKKNFGFTLIELLIVVGLIAILTGLVLSVVNSEGLRGRARDGQRISDVNKIQMSLELYFSDHRNYPASAWIRISGTDALSTALVPYIDDMPIDPVNIMVGPSWNNGPCSDIDEYRYNYRSDGSQYILTAIMEDSASNDDNRCCDLNAWGDAVNNASCSNTCTFTNSDVCYGLENP